MNLEDYIENLTPEQKAKAEACKTAEELMALAAENGIELTDEELDAISGGFTWNKCPDNMPPCEWKGQCFLHK